MPPGDMGDVKKGEKKRVCATNAQQLSATGCHMRSLSIFIEQWKKTVDAVGAMWYTQSTGGGKNILCASALCVGAVFLVPPREQ